MITLPEFVPAGAVRNEVIDSYASRTPHEVVDLWRELGTGSAAGGYIRLVDPAEWQPILAEACPGHDDAVVAFTTALGDMIVWEKGLFYLLRFRNGIVDVVGADATNFFTYVADARLLEWKFDWDAYAPAVERLGQPEFDECFGHVPLLVLGGPERVENLQRVHLPARRPSRLRPPLMRMQSTHVTTVNGFTQIPLDDSEGPVPETLAGMLGRLNGTSLPSTSPITRRVRFPRGSHSANLTSVSRNLNSMPPFTSVSAMPEASIREHSARVPHEIVELWREVGLATGAGGYLRLVDPSEWAPVIADAYPGHNDAVAIFATALGDVVVWERDYFNLLLFRKGIVHVVGKKPSTFVRVVVDPEYLDWRFDWDAYAPAVERLGQPEFDECFGYVPLLALGGPERVENLQRVKMREHILLISQLAGPLTFDAG
ncbi:T6SS immunity protein Tdi1 domain-containing protein [Frondihabitans sp. VKM Ac-2883]|uniref:T6SS immunity protein Tdi1 domain-containing protein n=1 Tax=Frondihabitans sp. VKM Ac-2883 TaxID=2783823 RepID=UPI00188D3CBE|nr:DUF1851 domain-containing protein [Frondihabitans sp. VKM Ac-2883]